MIEYKPREPRNKIIFPNAARTLLAIQQVGLDNLGILLDFGHSLYGLETPADAAQLCIDARQAVRHRRQRQLPRLGRRHGGRLGAPGGDVRVLPHPAQEQLGGRLAARPVPVPRGQRRGRQAGHPVPQGDAPRAGRPRRGRAGRSAGRARRARRAAAGPEGAADLDGRTRDWHERAGRRARHHAGARPAPATASRAEQIAHIAEAARQIRIQDLKLVHYAGAGHIGGDFSAIDILATLYGAVLDVTPETVERPGAGPVHPQQGPRRRRALHDPGGVRLPAGRRAGHLPQAAVRAERPPEPEQGPPASRPTPVRSVTACRSRSVMPCRPSSTSPCAAPTCWSATASCRRAATGRR